MKYSKTGLILVAVLLISAFSLADDDKDKAKDAASTITVAELRDHM